MWSKEDMNVVTKYMRDFSNALTTHLRLYAGSLGDHWLGVDRAPMTTHIYFSNDGIVAKIGKRNRDRDVVVRLDVPFHEAVVSRWKRFPVTGDKAFMDVHLKYPVKTSPVEHGVNPEIRSIRLIPLLSGSVAAYGPRYHVGISDEEGAILTTLPVPRDTELAEKGVRQPIPPWIFYFAAARRGVSALDGLDKDPIIEANALAQSILLHAGATKEEPSKKFRNAREALSEAILTLSEENEAAIHSVIKARPWILLDECDFNWFDDEVHLPYTERIRGSDGEIVETRSTLRPDFVYHMYEETLVVEIESATKQLLKKTQETGIQLPNAKTVAAMFQINNYMKICNGPLGSQIRGTLNKPDSWPMSFLLVAGSTQQPNFDIRSWEYLRQSVPESITLRRWDYYLDRLERLESSSVYGKLQ